MVFRMVSSDLSAQVSLWEETAGRSFCVMTCGGRSKTNCCLFEVRRKVGRGNRI